MRHGTAALAALFALLLAHPLQHDPPVPQRRVIGLVEIRQLLTADDADERPRDVAIALLQDPTDSSPIALTVRDRERLDTREHDYEELSAVVYGKRGGWYLLRARTHFAWLSPRDAGEFRAYPELLKGRLAYLTRDWNRLLSYTPGGPPGDTVAPISAGPPGERAADFGDYGARPSDVTVLDIGQHAGEPWVRVRIAPSICEPGPDPQPAIAEGWVPAYSPSGLPTLWFFSRGC